VLSRLRHHEQGAPRLRNVCRLSLQNSRYHLVESLGIAAHLSGPRAHLKPAVIVALGTGMRMGEQLRMKRHQVDFLRNIVTARDTKNGRPRDIPMNNDVRDTLAELCKDRRPDDYVFVSPKDSDERQREVAFEIHESQKVF